MENVEHICPVREVAELLSDTWTMLIMHALLTHPMRFCELERDLNGISTRTLTNKLRRLEEQALVKKQEDGVYAATEKGKGLRPVERAMRAYGEKFL